MTGRDIARYSLAALTVGAAWYGIKSPNTTAAKALKLSTAVGYATYFLVVKS